MQATFLLGPAGSGKTHRCLEEIRAELANAPEGLPIVLLAPKQATFQLERQLLAGRSLPGYTRLQILSFERLAESVLAELTDGPPGLFDEEGRIMVLRALLAQKQKELKVFRSTARLPGFARQLSLLLRELQRHRHSPDRLMALSEGPASPLGDKLHDLALLLRAYLDWLREHQLQDANSLLDLATEVLRKGPVVQSAVISQRLPAAQAPRPSPLAPIRLGGLWLDGFAEMTPQELDFLAALVPSCAQATLAFCLEDQADQSWLSTWSLVSRTFRNCRQRLAAVPDCAVEVKVLKRERGRGRFADNPALAHLEEHWGNPKPFPSGSGLTSPVPNPAGPDRAQLLLGFDDNMPARRSAGPPAVEASIRVAICPDLETEAVLAAREILGHVRAGGRYRDCAILLRTLDDYHDVLGRVFRRYEIPFFLDRREPVAYHPLAELTRYALRTVTFGWEHDDWFGALKTGLVPAAEDAIDRLENEALARGWSGVAWQQPLRMAGEEDPENRLERVRGHIIPPFQQLEKRLAGGPACGPTGSQLAAALREFWNQLNVGETLEAWSAVPSKHTSQRTPPPALHSTVLEQMQSWLGNLDLAFSNESLPLRDWLPILEAGLASLTVGVVPAALDQVLIGALDRSRNPELELAIVLGLNESVFPAAPALISLLSETDREHLEARGVALGPDKRAQLSQERYYGYVAFTRARRRLVLTCAARNLMDRPVNRSPFLAQLKRLFPALEFENYSPSRDWLDSEHVSELVAPLLRAEAPGSAARIPSLAEVASWPALASLREQLAALASYWPADSLSPALAGQLYGPVLRTSVSALEHFAACPFRYFVRAGMRAEERKLFEADVREQGSFQHAVLAAFHNQLRAEGKEWRDITPGEARERVRTAAAGLIAEFRDGLFEASDQNVFAARSLTAVLQDFIETLVGWMPQYGFDPRAVELSFGQDGDPLPAWEMDLGNGHRMALRGKMDRVDLAADPGGDAVQCVVVDYKSSAKKIDPLLLENGIQIQLPAYLAALRHFPDPRAGLGVTRLIPAGFFYVGLRGNYPAAKSRSEVLRDVVAARRLAHRHAGRFSLAALPLLDRSQPADPSGQFNYTLTRNGEPNRRHADPLEADEFAALLDRLENQLREMGRRIFAGDATVDPYRRGSEAACDECDFRAICRIDPWTHSFRVLKKSG